MPSRTEVSGLLSLGADPAPSRSKASRSSGQEFGRILQASSQPTPAANRQDHLRASREPSAGANREPSAGANREPSAGANREPSANAHKEPSAGANREPSAGPNREPSAGPNREPSASVNHKEPSANTNKKPSTNADQTSTQAHGATNHQGPATSKGQESASDAKSDPTSLQSEDLEAKLNLLQLASAETGDAALETAAELGLDKPLEALSAKELEALKAQVEQILQGLLNKLEAGELTEDQQEALAELLQSLEAGASEDQIAQGLEAIAVPLRLDSKDTQAQQASLRDLLGPAGQDYLAKLAEQLNGASERGSISKDSEAERVAKLGEKILEADQALTKKAEGNALKEKFSELLQLAQAERTPGRALDLAQSSPNTNALASLEAASGRQLQPAERGFVVQSEVRVPVGQQPQWSQAVGQRVLWMAAQNLSSAELRLDPPDLGPMQVKVSVHNDQISVNFTSAQASVREALDQGSARLREMFESEGLDLVNVDVSDQSEQQLAEEQQRRSGQSRGVLGDDEPGESKVTSIWVSDRLVDHYA